jgi:hypothetical protein
MAQKVGERGSGAVQVESLRVRRWRRDQFYELGFTLADARKLAEAPVDLGIARKLIGCGCPQPTALRILL